MLVRSVHLKLHDQFLHQLGLLVWKSCPCSKDQTENDFVYPPQGDLVEDLLRSLEGRNRTFVIVESLAIGEAYRGNLNRGNMPKRFSDVLGGFERVSERALGTSQKTDCTEELVTQRTSQRSPGTLSETLSEPLSQSAIFLSELRVLSAQIVLPLQLLQSGSHGRDSNH